MWADKHAPLAREDLAVHKKKIAEVSDWFDQSFRGMHGNVPLLLLTGESGVGKTATVRVLARELSASLIEWTNPTAASTASFADDQSEQFFSGERRDYEPSQATKFSDFLLHVERYPTLDILSGPESGSAPFRRRKIILIEDVPNVFLRDAAQFGSVLRRFVRTAASGGAITPAVFILSDSGGGNAVERSLFPADVRSELRIATIRFNAVAATSLAKALLRVVSAESAAGGTKRCGFTAPTQERVAELVMASAGDVRAAINALQFSGLNRTTQPHSGIFNGARRAAGGSAKSDVGVKRKVAAARGKKTDAFTPDAAANVESSGRDVNLSLFHALGKLLYCKRRPAAPDAAVLPAHLACHARDALIENPEHVVDRIALSPDYFVSFLHQNYVDFYASVDDVATAADYLSDCDELASDWSTRAALASYSSAIGARAIAFCNTSRAHADAKSTTGWRPLHKPQSMDVVKRANQSVAEARTLLFEIDRIGCGERALITELLPYWWALARETNDGFAGAARRRNSTDNHGISLDPRQRTFLRETVGFSPRGFSATARLQALDELAGGTQAEDCDTLSAETVNAETSAAESTSGRLNASRSGAEPTAERDVGKAGTEMELGDGFGVAGKTVVAASLNSDDNEDEDFLIESFDD